MITLINSNILTNRTDESFKATLYKTLSLIYTDRLLHDINNIIITNNIINIRKIIITRTTNNIKNKF